MASCQATISYKGREYRIQAIPYWVLTKPKGKQSSYIFSLIVDGFFRGRIARNDFGLWEPLDTYKKAHQPFYQAVGEVIERSLPGFV